jgi:hypothetical protein
LMRPTCSRQRAMSRSIRYEQKWSRRRQISLGSERTCSLCRPRRRPGKRRTSYRTRRSLRRFAGCADKNLDASRTNKVHNWNWESEQKVRCPCNSQTVLPDSSI